MPGEDPPRYDPRGPQLVYAAIADDLAAQIARGDLGPGDRLPSEAEIAERYGCARTTSARVMRELRRRGLAVTLLGKGSFVAPG